MNTPVSFELAKLLKEKGFDSKSIYHYKGDELINNEKPYNFNNPEEQKLWSIEVSSAPTIAEVVMWLYEKHGIWIEVTTNNNPQIRKEFVSFDARVIHRDRNIKFRVLMNTQINKYTEPFNSPTEAYEAAIKYCLTNLIN